MTAIADPAPATMGVPAPSIRVDGPVGYSIEPGNDRVEAIVVMPADQSVAELDAVIRDLIRRGWATVPKRYSRLLGDRHHVGLARTA